MSARALPPRPNLNQLKRQAKELLRRQPQLGRLRDSRRTIAEEYGFASWDALRTRVESLVATVPTSMIKPPELDSEEGDIVWNALSASDDGDVDALRRLLERDARLSRAEYWYTPAIHFAVREGHMEAVQLLEHRSL
ncbi:MAG: ankyrin repeat domain-containing protein [Gemmatimonadaceae bacterium]|nr:ankyrin repeat domain-containing protein [Gemmatimonadaceae bacterium]